MIRSILHKIDDTLFSGGIKKLKFRQREQESRQLFQHDLEKAHSAFPLQWWVGHHKNPNDLLAQLCDWHGTDKGSIMYSGQAYDWAPHTYADVYSLLFGHCRYAIRNVFECGLGTNNQSFGSSMGPAGKPGASLRVWRDYFPNAQIFGADIDRECLFSEERIKTFYVDQTSAKEIAAMWEHIGITDFDLIIDDGLHHFDAGCCLFENSVNRLSKSGIYIIEDVPLRDMVQYEEFFHGGQYAVNYFNLFRPNLDLGDNSLIVVRHESCL
jgi:hypothetical protein